jgi:hypothetical protein
MIQKIYGADVIRTGWPIIRTPIIAPGSRSWQYRFHAPEILRNPPVPKIYYAPSIPVVSGVDAAKPIISDNTKIVIAAAGGLAVGGLVFFLVRQMRKRGKK